MNTFFLGVCLSLSVAYVSVVYGASAQDTAAPVKPKPVEHVLGTITNVDSAAHTVTVKDDKGGTPTVVSLAGTKTLLKVEPGAKDLHNASRITADDLATGDRVDVRGTRGETSQAISARSVVLMSARDLAKKQEAEQQAWAHSTIGSVQSVDTAAHTLEMSVRSADGPKQMTVQASAAAFSRYSVDSPDAPASSAISEIQPGDQVHIVGELNTDGSTIAAQRIYSAPVRTLAVTVVSLAPDGKQLAAKNLQGQSPSTILIQSNTAVRKLPPEMAAMLARRFNSQAAASPQAPAARDAAAGSAPQSPAREHARGGDLSNMIEGAPLITAADLKPGDAVVVWGMAGRVPGSVVANTILAGVEPVFQAAPASRRGQNLNSDWGLDTSVPAQAQ